MSVKLLIRNVEKELFTAEISAHSTVSHEPRKVLKTFRPLKIRDVKRLIYRKYGIRTDRQILMIKGIAARDMWVLSEINVKNDCTITLIADAADYTKTGGKQL